MKIPVAWLKQFTPVNVTSDDLQTMLTQAGVAVDAVHEEVLELDLTPNRADCQSVLGVAFEVAALTGGEVTFPSGLPLATQSTASGELAVEILAPELCPAYLGLVVDVTVGDSPLWLQERLKSVGLRPINNVVDVTNLVMWELGQPLHAFDYSKVGGSRIVVRESLAGESITLIDGSTRTLQNGTLVIADDRRALAIAGVMGGLDSEVTATTTRIVLESALFERTGIRRTARGLGIRTEASGRFDKGVDPQGVLRALERAAFWLELLGMGRVCGPAVGVMPSGDTHHTVVLRVGRTNTLLGLELTPQQTQDILRRLGMSAAVREGDLVVQIPSRRGDVREEIDLVEEIGRVHGFSAIPTRALQGVVTQGRLTERQRQMRALRRFLLAAGLDEIVTLSFYDPLAGDQLQLPTDHALRRLVMLANPLSRERSALRPTLIASMIEVLGYNQARQSKGMHVFELGTRFVHGEGKPQEEPVLCLGVFGVRTGNWVQPEAPYDFYYLKGIVESLLPTASFMPSAEPYLHPHRQCEVWLHGSVVGILGEVHPSVGLKERTVIAELRVDVVRSMPLGSPHYSGVSGSLPVERDIAFVVDADISADAILRQIRLICGQRLAAVNLFDVYMGSNLKPGTRSLAVRLELVPERGSFTESQLTSILGDVRRELETAFGASWRA